MTCSVISDDEILKVKTHGLLDQKEREKVLKIIATAYDSCPAKAILIDHCEAEIVSSKKEAIDFGILIDFMFCNRWPCFIAVITNGDNSIDELIDLSIDSVNKRESKTEIQYFHNEKDAREKIELWLNKQKRNIVLLP